MHETQKAQDANHIPCNWPTIDTLNDIDKTEQKARFARHRTLNQFPAAS